MTSRRFLFHLLVFLLINNVCGSRGEDDDKSTTSKSRLSNVRPLLVDPLLCLQFQNETRNWTTKYETEESANGDNKTDALWVTVRKHCVNLTGKFDGDEAQVELEDARKRYLEEETVLSEEEEEEVKEEEEDDAKVKVKPTRQRRWAKEKPIDQKMMVELHNMYRRMVFPNAGDMKLMTWDARAAHTAQLWAENCEFEHGFSEDDDDEEEDNMGQNLYMGIDWTGWRAMRLWYDEHEYYNITSNECDEDQQCGHYTQLAWAESDSVGCGMSKCVKGNLLGYLVVCHYRPAGNHEDVIPYFIGAPCSQCSSRTDGGLCFNSTCVSKKECVELGLNCTCDLDCQNCGVLNSMFCRCTCKTGWDTLDCSRPCSDSHYHCRNSPGWPNMHSCSMAKNQVRDRYCRLMCKQCKTVSGYPIDVSGKNSSNYCCKGKMCSEGSILNNQSCSCIPICPGPTCFTVPGQEKGQLKEFEHAETQETTSESQETTLDSQESTSESKETTWEPQETSSDSQETTSSEETIQIGTTMEGLPTQDAPSCSVMKGHIIKYLYIPVLTLSIRALRC